MVSFTVRRPTTISRSASDWDSVCKKSALPSHLVSSKTSTSTPISSPLIRSSAPSPPPGSDSSNSDPQDELITGFDSLGVQRLHRERKPKQGLLMIPALKDKDWRELARKRRSAAQYVPPSAKAETGKDGTVGGLGTKDSINSGPALAGLQIKQSITRQGPSDDPAILDAVFDGVDMAVESELSEDQLALRAILAQSNGESDALVHIPAIPLFVSETDALRQDVAELPDVATMEDYARIPVAQFGAALLRGMGWKEGTAATRKPGRGLVEPYLPSARPALLGIGAKEREVVDDGSKRRKNAHPERRYVPIMKKERESSSTHRMERTRSRSPRRTAVSRRESRSPNGHRSERRNKDDQRERNQGKERKRDYSHDKEYDRDRERRRNESDKHRSERRDKSRDSMRRRRG